MPEAEKPVDQNEKRGFRRKRYIIPLVILMLLIAFRLYLPTLVKNHVNKVLAEIPGYHGQLDDIDISIFRATYTINEMTLEKASAKSEIPFLKFPRILISVDWEAVFEGKFASKIQIDNPEVTYVYEDWKVTDTKTKTEDWKMVWTKLVPLDINQFEVQNGKITFVQLSTDPPINFGIEDLELTATNLQTVVEKERILPAPIYASGISKGGGKFYLEGNMNLQKKIPEMDLSFSFENAKAEILNSFTKPYGHFYFEKGKLDIFGEADLTNANFKGFLKPILTDTEIAFDKGNYDEDLWEGFVLFFNDIIDHSGTEPLPTKIFVETKLDNPELGTWSSLMKSFSDSWIQTFKDKIAAEQAVKKPPLSKKELQKQLQEQKAQRNKELRPKKG